VPQKENSGFCTTVSRVPDRDWTETVMDIIRCRQLLLFGHICHMPDDWLVKMVLLGSVDGVRQRKTTDETDRQHHGMDWTDTMWSCSTVTRSCNMEQDCIWLQRSLTRRRRRSSVWVCVWKGVSVCVYVQKVKVCVLAIALLTWVDSRPASLYNLGNGSWLAWVNDTAVHYAAIQCPR